MRTDHRHAAFLPSAPLWEWPRPRLLSLWWEWPRPRLPLLVLILALIAGCSRSPSEQALRATLDTMQEAGENRDIGDFMDAVGEDFSGNGSEFDRAGLERLLRLVAMRHSSIGVTRTGTSIEMHGERAIVKMNILVTGGSGGLIPESGQLFETTSSWRFIDGEWILASATWTPAG